MRLVLAGVGLLIMIAGGVVAYRGKDSGRAVVITESTENTEGTEIVVDVGGAVERPGVYKLSGDARVNDALTAAGGLSGEADRSWVARYLNLAQVVADGAKLYIPSQGEDIGSTPLRQGFAGQVNINTASAQELDSLWGIGAKRAADIIANRPYTKTEELVTKAGVPQNVYEKIKDKITVF